jgi:small basic protein (TIGR04137 family)
MLAISLIILACLRLCNGLLPYAALSFIEEAAHIIVAWFACHGVPCHGAGHKSLQGASGIVIKRNVLKRFERVDLLKKRGQWKAGDRVQGLRKTKPDV